MQTWSRRRRSRDREEKRGGRLIKQEKEERTSLIELLRESTKEASPHIHTMACQPIRTLVSLTHPPSDNCSSMAHWSRCEVIRAMGDSGSDICIRVSASSLPIHLAVKNLYLFFTTLSIWTGYFIFPHSGCAVVMMTKYAGQVGIWEQGSDWREAMRARREARMVSACSPCTNLRSV